MQQVTLSIHGMSCQHCVGRVEKALSQLNGVEHVTVSLQQNQAEIQYDAAQVSPQQLQAAVTDIGYSAEIQ